jgi:hypothetical protein
MGELYLSHDSELDHPELLLDTTQLLFVKPLRRSYR